MMNKVTNYSEGRQAGEVCVMDAISAWAFAHGVSLEVVEDVAVIPRLSVLSSNSVASDWHSELPLGDADSCQW